MPRLHPVEPASATGRAKELLDGVKAKLGFVPNLMATMAQSPAVLEAYLQLSGAVAHTLDAKTREQIALVVAETNGCGYCAAAHSAIGKMVGLSPDAILAARQGNAADVRQNAILALARSIALSRGKVTQAEHDAAVAAGLSEKDVAEVVANVALNFFTNSFNNVAQTTIDFPAIEPLPA